MRSKGAVQPLPEGAMTAHKQNKSIRGILRCPIPVAHQIHKRVSHRGTQAIAPTRDGADQVPLKGIANPSSSQKEEESERRKRVNILAWYTPSHTHTHTQTHIHTRTHSHIHEHALIKTAVPYNTGHYRAPNLHISCTNTTLYFLFASALPHRSKQTLFPPGASLRRNNACYDGNQEPTRRDGSK